MNKFKASTISLAIALTAASANADSETDWARGAHEIDTDIGKLEYYNGFPSDATAQKLYDELDYQRATQAYIDTLPFVAFQGLYEGLVEAGAGKINDVPVFGSLLNSDTCVFTGNETTIYGFNMIYLEGEPAVLEMPKGATAGMIDNAWEQELATLGLVGPNEGAGGKWLILPPGYEGDVPEGYRVVQSDTDKILWMARGFKTPTSTADDARDLLRTIKVYNLSQIGSAIKFNQVDLGAAPRDFCYKDTDGYFDTLKRGMEREQGRVKDKMLTSKLATLGIMVGEKSPEPDPRMARILAKAEIMGNAMANTMAYKSRAKSVMKWDDRKYENIITNTEIQYEDDQIVDIEGRAAFGYQAITTSFAMIAEWVGKGSKYFAAVVDEQGKRFDGANTYRIPVLKDMPAGRFWSVTVYDSATRSLIKNELGVASIDSYADFERNSDGSVDVILSPDEPKGMESNWIQTTRGQGYFVYIRIYSPKKEYFTTFKMDDVVQIKDGVPTIR